MQTCNLPRHSPESRALTVYSDNLLFEQMAMLLFSDEYEAIFTVICITKLKGRRAGEQTSRTPLPMKSTSAAFVQRWDLGWCVTLARRQNTHDASPTNGISYPVMFRATRSVGFCEGCSVVILVT